MISDLRWSQNLGLVVLKSKNLKMTFVADISQFGQPTGKEAQKVLKLVNSTHPEKLGVSSPLVH